MHNFPPKWNVVDIDVSDETGCMVELSTGGFDDGVKKSYTKNSPKLKTGDVSSIKVTPAGTFKQDRKLNETRRDVKNAFQISWESAI